MARRKKSVWNAGRNLKRVTSNNGVPYFYRDGERIGRDSFLRSYKRRVLDKRPHWVTLSEGKPVKKEKSLKQTELFNQPKKSVKEKKTKPRTITVKEIDTNRDAVEPPYTKKDKSDGRLFSLCKVVDRKALYKQIISDIKLLKPFLTEEERSNLRVDLDIGYDVSSVIKRRAKKNNNGKDSSFGYRRFKDLIKLYRFLGLAYSYGNDNEERTGDFSKKGLCQYNKVAYLLIPVTRGERVIALRIFKKYIYNT
jgi:hypothetical protein